jgi:hypothetical protein
MLRLYIHIILLSPLHSSRLIQARIILSLHKNGMCIDNKVRLRIYEPAGVVYFMGIIFSIDM